MDRKLFSSDILGDGHEDRLSSLSWLVIFGVLVYQILYIFQGLDFTDTGFHLTAYQRIFSDPETVQYSFMFWLSNICGGVLMELIPRGGLMANRVVSVVVHFLTFWLYYSLLSTATSKSKAAIYTCLSLVFFQYYGFETLNYDSFTILSITLALYFLFLGSVKNSLGKLLVGAFVLGVSSYFRITNLAAVIFIPLTFLHTWSFDSGYSESIKKTALLMISYVIGHAAIILLMHSIGHLDLFIENMAFTKEMGAAGDSSHGFGPVMMLYLKGWLKVGLAAISCVILVILGKKVAAGSNQRMIYIAGGMLALVYLTALYFYPTAVWSKMRYMLYGGIVAYTCYLCYTDRTSQQFWLALYGLVFTLIFPLGSDSGIDKLYFCGGLSIALLLHYIGEEMMTDRTVRYSLLVLFLLTCGWFGYSNTYFDLGSRLAKTHSVDHKFLSNIYTTKERKLAVEELIVELDKYIEKDDYLLAFSDIPMVNYLTETKPYIGTSWPKLYYSAEIFKEKLNEAYKNLGPTTIVMQKMEMRSAWPTNDTPNYLDLSLTKGDESHPENRLPLHYQVMFDHIATHSYRLKWESPTFMVYKLE